jgi:hypothetical protein
MRVEMSVSEQRAREMRGQGRVASEPEHDPSCLECGRYA